MAGRMDGDGTQPSRPVDRTYQLAGHAHHPLRSAGDGCGDPPQPYRAVRDESVVDAAAVNGLIWAEEGTREKTLSLRYICCCSTRLSLPTRTSRKRTHLRKPARLWRRGPVPIPPFKPRLLP